MLFASPVRLLPANGNEDEMNKVFTIIGAVGFLLATASKAYAGEAPNMSEVLLAVSTIASAFGFQRSK